MDIKIEVKLTVEEVYKLLCRFDDSSDTPLHLGLDFESYSEKLSKFAYFVVAEEDDKQMGFIAYYLNEEGKFVYIPQVVVHKDARHMGVGHNMFEALKLRYEGQYESIRLEVLKDNSNARRFYEREGFSECEDHNERLLLKKSI